MTGFIFAFESFLLLYTVVFYRISLFASQQCVFFLELASIIWLSKKPSSSFFFRSMKEEFISASLLIRTHVCNVEER
jgi:hypothetical protein